MFLSPASPEPNCVEHFANRFGLSNARHRCARFVRHRTAAAGIGFAATILTSAFLLFEVQPLLSKFILPWFGGSPAVWTTAMLFFQVMLFAGYAYAHLLTRLFAPRWQAIVHSGLLIAAACLLPIAPDAAWKPTDAGEPTWRILALLAVCVGLPYLVLASTGPLVQAWYSRVYPQVVALSAVRAVERRFAGGTAQLSVLFRAGTRHLEPGLVVVGRILALRRACARAAVGGKPRQAAGDQRRRSSRRPLRAGSQLAAATGLAGAAGLRLGRAVGDDQPCLPGRGGDSVFVGRAAGPLSGDVHHRLRSRALVSAPRRSSAAAAIALLLSATIEQLPIHLNFLGELALYFTALFLVVHDVPRRIGAAQARRPAADVVLFDDCRRAERWAECSSA